MPDLKASNDRFLEDVIRGMADACRAFADRVEAAPAGKSPAAAATADLTAEDWRMAFARGLFMLAQRTSPGERFEIVAFDAAGNRYGFWSEDGGVTVGLTLKSAEEVARHPGSLDQPAPTPASEGPASDAIR
jgi:hypothetical protein